LDGDDYPIHRWAHLAQELVSSASPLWSWPSSWFGHPVTAMLADTLKRWIITNVPRLIRLTGYFARFHACERVDYVLAPYLKNVIDAAAVAATRCAEATRSVLIARREGVGPSRVVSLPSLFCAGW
jgi:hypothetical protein